MAGNETVLLTPGLLREKAAEIERIKKNHDGEILKLSNLIRRLPESWKGPAQATFNQGFEEMQPTFKRFAEMLQKYALYMRNYANTMEQTDIELSKTMKFE